jgi:hypothetical protein
MKEIINGWFDTMAPVGCVLACGVRHPDQTSVTKSWSDQYPEAALENAWRSVTDAFQVLKLNRLPGERMRWVYERALLYCERREDGACLAFFTDRDPQTVDLEGVVRLIKEFRGLEGS